MRLTCPVCGATASVEAWENDRAARHALDLVTRLPGMVQSRVLPYLGLFRQGDRGLAWSRALRLLQDLRDMVDAGTVRWEGGECRPCPPQVWAAALDAVLARRPKGLKNHNYLRHVAWEMASGEAARAELSVERQRRGTLRPRGRETVDPPPQEPPCPVQTPASEEERAEVLKMLKAFAGRLGGTPGRQSRGNAGEC